MNVVLWVFASDTCWHQWIETPAGKRPLTAGDRLKMLFYNPLIISYFTCALISCCLFSLHSQSVDHTSVCVRDSHQNHKRISFIELLDNTDFTNREWRLRSKNLKNVLQSCQHELECHRNECILNRKAGGCLREREGTSWCGFCCKCMSVHALITTVCHVPVAASSKITDRVTKLKYYKTDILS